MCSEIIDEEHVKPYFGSRKALAVHVSPCEAAIGGLVDTPNVLTKQYDVRVLVVEGGRENATPPPPGPRLPRFVKEPLCARAWVEHTATATVKIAGR